MLPGIPGRRAATVDPMSIHLEPSHLQPAPAPAPSAPSAPSSPLPPPTGRTRPAGIALAAGAVAWAVGTVIAGDQMDKTINTWENLGGLMFQLGLVSLMLVLLSTGATGTRRGRAFPVVELVLLVPAIVWTLGAFTYRHPANEPTWLQVVDVCWPLSMLGMIFVGAAVAKADRWTGSLRWHLLVASLWLIVMIPIKNIAGIVPYTFASAGWLVATYGTLGLRLARRPHA
ncbi:hypothetical protein [Pseudofrankia sp. EUN1h]|uniref:hypothetical protein n=2 Tax=Pseudofrankia TaxID=2994363 RepID=UPI000234B652|nr:hypothetical protein [Pseudofrankia sp. EUN1h]